MHVNRGSMIFVPKISLRDLKVIFLNFRYDPALFKSNWNQISNQRISSSPIFFLLFILFSSSTLSNPSLLLILVESHPIFVYPLMAPKCGDALRGSSPGMAAPAASVHHSDVSDPLFGFPFQVRVSILLAPSRH